MDTDPFDVVIVGGGPAGLSAALVLGRARRSVLIVDAGHPRNAPASHMQGFISRDGTPPAELLARAREELERYGVTVVADRVTDATGNLVVTLASGRAVAGRRLLIASGARDVLPDLPGARKRWGRDFLHCPYCHGWEVRDQAIGVLATGPASVEHAHLLRQWSSDVTFFTDDVPVARDEREALLARGIVIVDGRIERLVVDDDRLRGVGLTDGRAVERDVVFIRPLLRPHDDGLVAGLGCRTGDDGLVEVDREGRTSVPGVWAAGNASNPRAQVITAAGEGSAVAIAINTDLVRTDIAAAERAITRITDTKAT